jgi:glutamyl-tRNA synthetase
MEIRRLVRKFALLNAVQHEGRARESSVIGKLLAEKPQLKTEIKQVAQLVKEIVQEVNSLSSTEQRRLIEENWPGLLAKKKAEEEKKLPPLPNVDRYSRIVTRFSPNPDCVLHLGSARAIILCHEYAKMYRGKFLLRFEDTDPRLKRTALEFYDKIRDDLEWLGCKPDEEYIQSDRILIYYEYARKLLQDGNAYVCTCNRQEFRRKILAKQPCSCRGLPPEVQLERWDKMLNGAYSEGGAVVRIKTDITHPNPAIRDWPALRIIDTDRYPHPRVGNKYRVWPLYNFACGIDDHLMEVTHIIRGKEHLTNQRRQEYMYKHFGWGYPEAIHYGRLKITGAFLSKSKIIQGIRDGTFKSWDDPRLATFLALRRRGITPEAIRQLIIDVGPKTVDVVLSWENLYAYNRKVLDPKADRYFFVESPVQLTVKNVPKIFHVKLYLHPEHPERGSREYRIEPKNKTGEVQFWVSRTDYDKFKEEKLIRLMGLFNIEIAEVSSYAVESHYHSETYQEAKKLKAPLIHWIPINAGMPCEVVMPDASTKEGIAEKLCRKLRPNAIIQFERFGFVRIDKVNRKLTVYYAHR